MPSLSPLRLVRDEEAPAYDTSPKRVGFTMIPDPIRSLNDGYCVAVYEAIARYANQDGICWPSIALVCQSTGWSRKIVERAINTLVAKGLITKEKRRLNGMDQSNLYRITPYEQVVPRELAVVPWEPLARSLGTIGTFPQNDEQEPVDQQPIDQEAGTPPNPQKGGDGEPPIDQGDDPPEKSRKPKRTLPTEEAPEFVAFYALYPRKEDRKAAWRAWWRMEPSTDRVAEIMTGINRLLPDYRGRERRFIPQPSTFLNGERWKDDPQPLLRDQLKTSSDWTYAEIGEEVKRQRREQAFGSVIDTTGGPI